MKLYEVNSHSSLLSSDLEGQTKNKEQYFILCTPVQQNIVNIKDAILESVDEINSYFLVGSIIIKFYMSFIALTQKQASTCLFLKQLLFKATLCVTFGAHYQYHEKVGMVVGLFVSDSYKIDILIHICQILSLENVFQMLLNILTRTLFEAY